MIKFLFLILSVSFLWISCTDDNMSFNIGNDNLDVKSRIAFIDTFTVKSYTVMLDSVPTSGLQNPAAVVGYYDDPQFGTITANSYFTVSLPSKVTGGDPKYGIPKDAVLDSVSLFFIYNKYYEGDTTALYTVHAHRLTQKIRTSNSTGMFYNNDSIPALTEILGQVTTRPSPVSGDTIWITLEQEFGSELFEYMKDNNSRVTDAENFENYFKGFKLASAASNKAIIGFRYPAGLTGDAYPAMRVYYHYTLESKVNKYFNFNVRPDAQFNQFSLLNRKVNFPSDQHDKLPVALTGNNSFVHAGVGVVTRLEIPYLKNLYYLGDNIQLLNAEIEIEPAINTYTDENLPLNIGLYETDDLNRWGDGITTKTGKTGPVKLTIDMLYQEETRYTFEITNFIKSSLEQESDDLPSMLLTITPEDLYKTTSRLVLGSQKNRVNKVRLKVYYMNIE